MLGHRDRDVGNGNLLERVPADKAVRNIRSDGYHRDAVHERRGDACYQVRRARTAGGENHACLTCGSGVTVRRVGRSLLMSRHHVVDLIRILVERVIDVERSTARIPEYRIHTMLQQNLHNQL